MSASHESQFRQSPLTTPAPFPNIERMSSTAQVQQGQQTPPVHPPGEHPLAQLVRDNTNHGEMIVHFLIDAMRGRIDAAKPSHRIDAARLLLKLGCDDAREFIADFSRHTRPGGGSAFSSGAIVGRHNRQYVTRLAKFARSQTGNGKDLVNFLVDAMLGRPEDFKPAARLTAAKELLRLGWETVPTVGRNRKARRSEAAANGLLVDSRKAAPNGPKANGPQAAPNGRKANGPRLPPTAARPMAPKLPPTAPRPTYKGPSSSGPRKISQETGPTARLYGSPGARQPTPTPTPTAPTTSPRTRPATRSRRRPTAQPPRPPRPKSPKRARTRRPRTRKSTGPRPPAPAATSAKPCARASTSGATPPAPGYRPTSTRSATSPPPA